MKEPQSAPATPRPAATVVLLRPTAAAPEVLLIHRPGTMAFGPGLHAFPGGRVDPEDSVDPSAGGLTAADAAGRLGGILPAEEALAVHQAAVREVAEEVGVTISPRDLAPIALWTTPTFMPRRFATWFFVADLPPDARPVFAPDEVAAHRWLTADAALDERAAGGIEMWIPTTSVLERLREIDARRAADVAARIRIRRPAPPAVVDESDDAVTIRVGGVGGLPGRSGLVTILGRRDVVVVDPGDPSEAAMDAVLEVAARRSATIRAIVLTAPDPDRAGGAEALAIPLDVPVLVAPGAGKRLPHDVREVADGERLPLDIEAVIRLGPARSGRLEVVRA